MCNRRAGCVARGQDMWQEGRICGRRAGCVAGCVADYNRCGMSREI